MSQTRRIRRAARAAMRPVGKPGSLTERFAHGVGTAIAEYGGGGGSLDQACYALLRFAAQCAMNGGASTDDWSKIAAKAWSDETARPEERAEP